MAGRGPAPKEASRLGGHGAAKKRTSQMRVVQADPVEQPTLESIIGDINPLTDAPWHRASIAMWEHLAEFPTTNELQAAQWDSLARAVMIDDAMLSGKISLAGEARLRFSKYGIDPDDLSRLKVQIIAAEVATEKRSSKVPSSRQTFGPLKAVDGA